MEQAKLWNGSSPKPSPYFLKIQTDALKLGFRAVCQRIQTGGPWTYKESQFHINYLELLAAFLAIQSFVKREKRLTVYLCMDNVSGLTYINKKEGVQSQSLTTIAKEWWEWCMERAIVLSAEHLPDCLNTIADEESRHRRDRWDWKLHPGIFQRITNIKSCRIGFVCFKADIPSSMIFQLETRSPDRGNQCLPTKMESFSGICKPTMGS